MKFTSKLTTLVSALLLAPHVASAHTSYGTTTRDLGPAVGSVPGLITGATGALPYLKTINTQVVTSNFGWAAGTEAAFGDAHHIKAYRFSLAEAGWATINVTAAARGTGTGIFLPAFSLYTGLLHTDGNSDTDTSVVTQAYLATLGDPQPRRGAFDALHTLKIGNDIGEMSTLNYFGNAADGTSTNFGGATGINGDGLADGSVTGSFWLPAGDYSLLVGGADISGSSTGTFGIDVSLTVVPEISSSLLVAISGLGLIVRRRR